MSHTVLVDWRWLLLSLVVALVAGVRWRRRAPEGDAKGPGESAASGGAGPAVVDEPGTSDGRGSSDRSQPSRGRSHSAQEPEAAVDRDLDAALDRIWVEHAHDAETLLDARLHQLMLRRVPARALRPAPGARAVRVVFADGTIVLCRGTGQGDFGRLGMALHRHSVWLGGFAHDPRGTRLEFRWSLDQRLAALAVGLDQPD